MTDTCDKDLELFGVYEVTIKRANGDIEKETIKNRIVGEGKEHILKLIANQGGVACADWYVGLLANDRTVDGTENAADVTAPGGGVVDEYAASVWTGATRPVWTDDTVSGSGDGPYSIDNDTTKASYTVDTGQSATVYGVFIVSSATIQGTSGVLLSIAKFSASKALAADDEIQSKYTLTYAAGA